MQRSALAVTVLILVAAGGVVHLRRAPAPLPVDEAVRRYRQSQLIASPDPAAAPTPSADAAAQPAETQRSAASRRSQSRGTPGSAVSPAPKAAPTSGQLPKPGVYSYRTSGGEQVDVLGGSRHDYPATTTVTITHEGCGYSQRWQPLEQRWDERRICPGPSGDLLRTIDSYHEFFRDGDRRTFTCDPTTLTRPPASAPPGTSWQGKCVSGPTTAINRGSVVGRERIDVAGASIETIHIRVDVQVSGDQTGSSRVDGWAIPETGLVVREIATTTTDSQQPPFGNVRYHEEYEIVLLSLEPRQ
jgi:hypothetical protein